MIMSELQIDCGYCK